MYGLQDKPQDKPQAMGKPIHKRDLPTLALNYLLSFTSNSREIGREQKRMGSFSYETDGERPQPLCHTLLR